MSTEPPMSLAAFLRARGYRSITMQKSAVGHFELPVRINDHEALMLLDTGASMTVIAQESAKRLGLAPEIIDEKGGGLGATDVAVSRCTVDSFVLDAMEMHTRHLYVMDLSHVNQALEARGARRPDGVIGADILNSTSAIIDYSESVLYLKTEQNGT